MTKIDCTRHLFHAATLLAFSMVILPNATKEVRAEDFLASVAPVQIPAEVNDFKLTEDLLKRMEKIDAQLDEMQLSPTEEEGEDARPSIDSMVKSIERRPQVVTILQAENIKPRDYVIAYFAMMSALAAADAQEEDQLVNEVKGINPEHLEFGKKYGDRIRDMIGE